jgi:hypothetical protein
VAEAEDEARLVHLHPLHDLARLPHRDRRRERQELVAAAPPGGARQKRGGDEVARGLHLDVAGDVHPENLSRGPFPVELAERARLDRRDVLGAALVEEPEGLVPAHLLDEAVLGVGRLVVDEALDGAPEVVLLLLEVLGLEAAVDLQRLEERGTQELEPAPQDVLFPREETLVHHVEAEAHDVPLADLADRAREGGAVQPFQEAADGLHAREEARPPPQDHRQDRAAGHGLVQVADEADEDGNRLHLPVAVDRQPDASRKVEVGERRRRWRGLHGVPHFLSNCFSRSRREMNTVVGLPCGQ